MRVSRLCDGRKRFAGGALLGAICLAAPAAAQAPAGAQGAPAISPYICLLTDAERATAKVSEIVRGAGTSVEVQYQTANGARASRSVFYAPPAN